MLTAATERLLRASALAAALALFSQPIAPAGAFEWVGKIDKEAEGLKHEEPEKRLSAIQRLATFSDSVGLVKPHLLGALDDPDDKVRAAAGRVLARFGVTEAIPKVTTWLNAIDPQLRIAATDILGDLGERKSAKALIRTLGDPEDEVRLHAVIALGKLGSDEAVVPLIARLGDNKADVRRAAIAQLAELGDSRALIPLVGAMNDASTDARLAAIRAVGQLGDVSAVPALMRLLRDPLEPIKVAAIAALGSLRATEATDRLITALGTGSDDFRGRAAYSLGQIAFGNRDPAATRRAVRALVAALANPRTRQSAREALLAAKTAATKGLIDHLRGETPGDPKTAVRILRDIGDKRATPVLLTELERGRLSKHMILDALSKAGDERALVPVLSLLSEKDAGLRLAAMKAIGPMLKVGSPAADVLLEKLGDREREIQLLAASYLGQIRATAATARLAGLAKGSSDRVLQIAALKALKEIRDPKSLPTLLELLGSGPTVIRREAAHAIMMQDDEATADALLEMINRRRASRTLLLRTLAGVIRGKKNPKARAALERLAKNARLIESIAAIVGLGALGDPKAEKTLASLTQSKTVDRRRAATTALGDIGATGSSKRLIKLLEDDDDSVAGAAALSLGKLGSAAAVPALERTLRRRGFAAPVNASAALVMLSTKATVAKWDRFLHHPRRLVRANAVLAASGAKKKDLRGELEYLLARDQSWNVRRNSARALSQLGGAKRELDRAAQNDNRDEVKKEAEAVAKTAFVAPARDTWLVLYVVDPTSDDSIVAQEPYFVIGSDGIATAFYSDVLGQATEEQFPDGEEIHGPMTAETEF